MKIAPVSADLLVKLGLLAAVAVGALYLVNKASGAAGQAWAKFGDIGANISTAAADAASAADNAVANVVVTAGGLVGIPATDNDQCSLDLAAGRLWDASFSCPASRFIKEGVFK